ncbi:glycosyltransferase family 4 protein [Marinobacter confluentis]|uniref:Glycosyltransferase n=1 Tax=Marinobacter confluentis TaxID=1697557 RepID=A0A4Z1CBY4_9GAMM|nr:glycosyltransferase family 4 protein [Marinobacter confluentis]TGN41523.1 glycosyltransferase [Marinobacter confluentis]
MNILMTAMQPGGGILTFFRYIYSHPAFEGFTFTLLAPDEGLSDYLSEFLPNGRITVTAADSSPIKFLKQARSLSQNPDFDLVHSHGFSAGVLTEFAMAGVRRIHLMTAHDVFNRVQFQGFKGHLKHRIMAAAFQRMDAIHTVTEDAKANLIEFFPDVASVHIVGILHGVDTEYFRDGKAEPLKESLGLARETPLIGFFGRFMGQKGFRLVVQALKRIRDEQMLPVVPHVATFGWGGFIREDYAYLEELGLKDYFHQMPQANNMAGALKGVDLVAMPSRWEACGLLAMEALAAGAPIVGSACVGLREVLDGTPAQQVAVGNYGALADALVAEIENLDQRRGAFLAYQDEAVERFAIDRPAQALAELYRQLGPRAF